MLEKISEDSNQLFEQKLELIKRQWDQTLLELLRSRYGKRNKILPILDEDKLIREAPNLLEDLTKSEGEIQENNFILLTAPTGVGKGTVGKKLEEASIAKLPRVNTRPIRLGEIEGKDYFFISDEDFEKKKTKGEIFCCTSTAEESIEARQDETVDEREISRTKAGIPTKEFRRYVRGGKKFYIDCGAGTARKLQGESEVRGINFKTIFLLPPTFEEMKSRVLKRSREENKKGETIFDETLIDRFMIAINHLRNSIETVDSYVVNDDVGRASERLKIFLK